jgi:hypothetical protein
VLALGELLVCLKFYFILFILLFLERGSRAEKGERERESESDEEITDEENDRANGRVKQREGGEKMLSFPC